ncbi:MAG: rhodanese-like domain-containing protein [Verrucomicrobia bacterium]|nr:rhodanese-like domain-containing protein [Verrucomicrobiota bacterium]
MHIVVYCDRGERAALASNNLPKTGYPNVRSLKGAWKTGFMPAVAKHEPGLPGPVLRFQAVLKKFFELQLLGVAGV